LTVSRRRVIIWCGVAIGAAVLWCFFPPFRIKRIGDALSPRPASVSTSAPVNVAHYAEELWNDRLPGAFGNAVDIEELFAAVDRDAGQARSKFGRQVGLGGACFLFIRGTGQVEEAAADCCTLKIGEGPRRVRIRTGAVVGNTVRDSTGLVDVNQFANVIAPARERLRVGARVRFVGCAAVSSNGDFDSLIVIPVQLDIEDAQVQP
jgi:hypothetical protein